MTQENAQTELEITQVDTSATDKKDECITPVTVLDDVATIFVYDGDKTYEPNNYHEKYNEEGVTVRYALEHSLNVPTIKIAERIGYAKVADLARRSGLNAKIKGYPSVALGAFEVTPLEMAGAYTIFANSGKYRAPHALMRVLDAEGAVVKSYDYPDKQVLSPQVAYLMTHLMEGVIQHGTAVSVRSRGFDLPAAGKTGTSRDGWFAGYTKDFIAIAWVGFDDNTDLNMEGAHSALPIWTEFMKKAQQLYPPRDLEAMFFAAPEGIVHENVEHDTKEMPIKGCEMDYTEAFLEGSVDGTVHCGQAPEGAVTSFLDKVGDGIGGFFKGILGIKDKDKPTEPSNKRAEPSTSSH